MDLAFYKSIILGAVQGFTEFLPISSTAHLILSSKLMNLESSEFIKSFIIIIQFASILAVVVLYRKKIFKDWEYLKKLFVACIPTGVLGLLAYKLVKNYLQENLNIIALALLIGGIIMIILERKYQAKKDQNELKNDSLRVDDIKHLSYKQCLIIGVFQALAMIPGVSRSAATVIGGL